MVRINIKIIMVQEILALSVVALAVFYTLWSIYKISTASKSMKSTICSACPAKGRCY
ncbi:MAG: hypothetical protein ACLFNU_01235 [Bacteroidales bacterium]